MGAKCGKGVKHVNLQSLNTTGAKNALLAAGKAGLSEVKQVLQGQVQENVQEFLDENGEKIEKVKKSADTVKKVLFSGQNEENAGQNEETEKQLLLEKEAEVERRRLLEVEEERRKQEEIRLQEEEDQRVLAEEEVERKRQEIEDAEYLKYQQEQERLLEEERRREDEYDREREAEEERYAEQERIAEEERMRLEGNNEGSGEYGNNNNNYDNYDNYDNNYNNENYEQNDQEAEKEGANYDQPIEIDIANADAFFAPEKEKNLLEVGEFEENNVFNHMQIDLNKDLEIEENNKQQVFFVFLVFFNRFWGKREKKTMISIRLSSTSTIREAIMMMMTTIVSPKERIKRISRNLNKVFSLYF